MKEPWFKDKVVLLSLCLGIFFTGWIVAAITIFQVQEWSAWNIGRICVLVVVSILAIRLRLSPSDPQVEVRNPELRAPDFDTLTSRPRPRSTLSVSGRLRFVMRSLSSRLTYAEQHRSCVLDHAL
jgi:hypothetical protein